MAHRKKPRKKRLYKVLVALGDRIVALRELRLVTCEMFQING